MAFLAGRMGETFDAMVLGFTKFGARIELVDHLIDGICPFHAMPGDYVTVNSDGLSAKGRYSGAVMRVGDILKVTLARVDRLAGEAQFAPEGWPPEGTSRRAGEPGRRGKNESGRAKEPKSQRQRGRRR